MKNVLVKEEGRKEVTSLERKVSRSQDNLAQRFSAQLIASSKPDADPDQIEGPKTSYGEFSQMKFICFSPSKIYFPGAMVDFLEACHHANRNN